MNISRHSCLCSLMFAATGLAAQGGASLLADINPVLSATSPGGGGNRFFTVGATTYFTGSDGVSGSQLWKTDGTAAGTLMIKVLSVNGSPNVDSMASLNGVLYFRATDDINTTNTELWRSDGTVAGTYRVADINPGPDGSAPSSLFEWNGAMWFTADDGVHGRELWRSDGTTAGTAMVRDINPGVADGVAASLQMRGLPNVFNYLFFAADNGVLGTELWRSDGTTGGTALVRDINPGSGSSNPAGYTLMPSSLIVYFAADNGSNGREVWTTTGLLATTSMFKDINPGSGSSSPAWFTVMGSALYFAANDGAAGAELWSTLGSALLTSMVRDINPGSASSSPVIQLVLGTQLAIVATTATNGRELWRSNGSTAGTVLVKDIVPGVAALTMTGFTALGSIAVFTADDGAIGKEFWRTDLTTAGTFPISDIVPGAGSPNPFVMTAVQGSYALCLANDGVHGQEVWRCNGTAAGTFLLKDLAPQTSASSPDSLLDMGQLQGVLFAATDGVRGRELWKSDGTAAGTFLVKDIQVGAGDSAPILLGMLNGIAYLGADDGVNGRELWRTDGTPAGTFLIKDIRPGSASSNAGQAIAQSLTTASAVLDGILYFPADDGTNGAELWRTDGTAAGTFLVRDINPGAASSAPVSLIAVNGLLFLSATETNLGREMWKSDGTANGTVLLKGDVYPGAGDSCFVRHLPWAFGNRLVCPLRDPVNGYELWMSDGTAAGTTLIKDINPGTSGSSPQDYVELNGIVYFTAYDATFGQELWKTDGTPAGTQMVKDIYAGSDGSWIQRLTRLGNEVLFFAEGSYGTGHELWKTDGTALGTVLVKDINPGTASGIQMFGWIVAPTGAQTALFTGADGAGGVEIWRTDGTTAGTVRHTDLHPGVGSTKLGMPVLAGSRLFLQADIGNGAELYSMVAMACAVPYGQGCRGQFGTPTLLGRGAPTIGNATYADVVSGGLPNSTAVLFYGVAPAQLPLGRCTVWIDLLQPYFTLTAPTDSRGSATFPLPIPANRALTGAQGFTMAGVVDPAGSYANILSLTGGLEHVYNTR